MEAVEAAQRRTEERDRLNQQRSPFIPVVQPIAEPLVRMNMGVGGGDAPSNEDTRTEHDKYLDAISVNQYVGAIPGIGPVIGALNDAFIEGYEAANPDKVTGGGPKKFSTLGQVMGKGLTVAEQLAAKDAGLGLGKMLGLVDQKPGGGAQPGYSLFDRVFGTTPMNVAARSDYIGSFPQGGSVGGGGGWETSGSGPGGTTNFGGRESAVGGEDRSGYA